MTAIAPTSLRPFLPDTPPALGRALVLALWPDALAPYTLALEQAGYQVSVAVSAAQVPVAPQGWDRVVVHDLTAWSVAHASAALRDTYSAGAAHGVAPVQALIDSALVQLGQWLSPAGQMWVVQPATGQQGAMQWGWAPVQQALLHGPRPQVRCWAALGSPAQLTGWWSPDAVAYPTRSPLHLMVAGARSEDRAGTPTNDSVNPLATPTAHHLWPEMIVQGHAPSLAPVWLWEVGDHLPSRPSAYLFHGIAAEGDDAPRGQALDAIAAIEEVPDHSPWLDPHASNALTDCVKALSTPRWTFESLALGLNGYLKVLDALAPTGSWQTALALPNWHNQREWMPDRVGRAADGQPYHLQLDGQGAGEMPDALDAAATPLPPDQASTAFLLLALQHVLARTPCAADEVMGRKFTRLQWVENVLSAAGWPLTAADFEAAGNPPARWAGHEWVPMAQTPAAIAERNARILALEHQLHYTDTDKNRALEQLAQMTEVAQGVSTELRQTLKHELTDQITQQVSAQVRQQVHAELSAAYESTLSWRVTRPLRGVRQLLSRLRQGSRASAPPPEATLPNRDQSGHAATDPSAAHAHAPTPAGTAIAAATDTNNAVGHLPALVGAHDRIARWDYGRWVGKYDVMDEPALNRARLALGQLSTQRPLVLVCAPEPGQWDRLPLLVQDLRQQVFTDWNLLLAVPKASASGPAASQVDDPRIHLVSVPDALPYAQQIQALVAALPSMPGFDQGQAWVGLITADTRLMPTALADMALALADNDTAHLAYSDVDTLSQDEGGQWVRTDPWFKPDWNPELFLSSALAPQPGHSLISGVLWASYARLCSWEPLDVPPHWVPLSAALHVLGQGPVVQTTKPPVVHVPRVSSHHPFAPLPEALRQQGLALIQRHVAGTHPGAVAELTAFGARVRQPLPATLPWVSVLIPTRNNPALLNQCLASLFGTTRYPNFDVVVVDNGSDTPEALACLAKWNQHERVRVIRDNSVFNYAALNNHAVAVAQGDWVALLNDDIEVTDADWLHEMVSQAVRPDVGVVGARLLYPNGTLQHGGVFLVGTLSWHAHRHLDQAEPGYAGRAQLVQNLSCLTAACIVVKKQIYQQVAGLDATHFTVGWNDTDLCLKVQKAGYRNLWTPFATLIHHESATRGQDQTPEKQARAEREWRRMQACWGDQMHHDPAYNDNLSCGYEDFSLAWPPRGWPWRKDKPTA